LAVLVFCLVIALTSCQLLGVRVAETPTASVTASAAASPTRAVATPVGGRPGSAWAGTNDVILTWHREGGIAGFCDEVKVYGSGEASVSTCKGGETKELGHVQLSPEQMGQLRVWVETLRSFEFEHTDQAVADAMTIRLAFAGKGAAEASDADKQAMQDLAAQLYAQVGVPSREAEQSYTSAGGHFTIQYPADYAFYENQRPSVDGLVVVAPQTVAVYKVSDPSFILSIEYKQIEEGLSTEAFAQQDDSCVASSSQKAEIILDGKPAIQYIDTPCGPYGSTVIYLAHGALGYRFTIEAGTDYRSIEGLVQPILDTFRTEDQ
jgi:hypothetical protein